MVGEIEKTIKTVKALIDKYNAEFDLLKEVMTKSVSEKINEVREEEKKKAEDALKKQALEHQVEAKKAAEKQKELQE